MTVISEIWVSTAIPSVSSMGLCHCCVDLRCCRHRNLTTPSAGFSFKNDGPLDMRMDQNQTVTAAEIVNGVIREKELSDIFFTSGEKCANPIVASCTARSFTIAKSNPFHFDDFNWRRSLRGLRTGRFRRRKKRTSNSSRDLRTSWLCESRGQSRARKGLEELFRGNCSRASNGTRRSRRRHQFSQP